MRGTQAHSFTRLELVLTNIRLGRFDPDSTSSERWKQGLPVQLGHASVTEPDPVPDEQAASLCAECAADDASSSDSSSSDAGPEGFKFAGGRRFTSSYADISVATRIFPSIAKRRVPFAKCVSLIETVRPQYTKRHTVLAVAGIPANQGRQCSGDPWEMMRDTDCFDAGLAMEMARGFDLVGSLTVS
eukprot:4150263-Amphidinium_carterae.1